MGGSAKVVIIGSGFAGIGLAHRLRQAGIPDVLILERGDDVGGVWHANTYPGCTCDVPSHLYSFSFAPDAEWTSTFSPQPEIRRYLRTCVDRFGLRPRVRLGVAVLDAAWDAAAHRWRITTSDGPYDARLVSAVGPLTEPNIPDVPGIGTFRGKLMHSARWDHSYDMTGKIVASIGTGASAIQYVPHIADRVSKLYVLQRTPPWITAHTKRPITDRERALYRRVPFAQKAIRAGVYATKELLVLGFVKHPALMERVAGLSKAHLARQVADPALRRRLISDYTFGCKRLVPSNEYHVTDIPIAAHLRGRDGRTLAEHWQGSPRAYLGTSVPGFPNLFLMLGPNTGSGHTSMVYMIESQIAHVRNQIRAMDAAGAAAIDVDPQVHDAYNREVDRKMTGTVWNVGGCRSFYFDATGRNAALWPDWSWRFRRRAQRRDHQAYRFARAARPAVAR